MCYILSFDWRDGVPALKFCWFIVVVGQKLTSRHPPRCTAVWYLFAYLLPNRYPGTRYSTRSGTRYPGNEMPGDGSPNHHHTPYQSINRSISVKYCYSTVCRSSCKYRQRFWANFEFLDRFQLLLEQFFG